MAMTACYRNFDMPQISQGVSNSQHLITNHQIRHHNMSLQSLQTSALTAVSPSLPLLSSQQSIKKDYGTPLHVDCSVEYELPNQAKPPVGTRIEPLLMIHPCYFRKMESQRRSPFINNMPNQLSSHINQNSAISSSSIDSSNINRSLMSHLTNISSKHHSTAQSTTQHQNQISGKNNLQLPCSIALPSSAKARSMHHQPQVNLKQQIDNYVQRQIVQMSAPPPPSVTYSSISDSHISSQHNSQSSSSNLNNINSSNNNNHYIVQQSQRRSSTWDAYNVASLGQHHKSIHQQHHTQKHKYIQSHNLKQASFISNTATEGGGLLCSGSWSDVIEKSSSLAAIPRDYQAGPECIPNNKTTISDLATSSIYKKTVGKRDAMLSGGCNTYNKESTEISFSNMIWKSDKASISREYHLESNNNNKNVKTNSNNKSSSSSNGILTLTSNANHQSNHNYNNQTSVSAQVAQGAQDHRHLLSGKYKQYLRSQRMHPYSMLSNSIAGAVVTDYPQLGTASTLFQQVSCYNV